MKPVNTTLSQVLPYNNLKEKIAKLLSKVKRSAAKAIACFALLFSFTHAEQVSEPLIILGETSQDHQKDSSDLLQLLRRQSKSQTKKIELLEQELISTKEKLKQIKSDLMVKGYSTEKVLKDRISQLEQILTEAQHSLSSAKLQLQEKAQQLALKKQELEQTISSFSDSSARLHEKIQQQELDLKRESEQLARQGQLEDANKNTISSLQKDNESLDRKLQEALPLIQTLHSQISYFQLTIDQVKKDKIKWKEIAAENETHASAAHSYATSLEERFEREGKKARAAVKSLQSALLNSQRKGNFLGGSLFDILTRLKYIELKVNDLEKTLFFAEEKARNQNEEAEYLFSSLQEEKMRHQNELQSRSQNYEEYINGLETKIAEVENQAIEAENLIIDLQEMLAAKTNASKRQEELISKLHEKSEASSLLAFQNKTYTAENYTLKNQVLKAREAQGFFGTYVKTKQEIRTQMNKALEKHYEVVSLEKESLEESVYQLERALSAEKIEKEQIADLAKQLVDEVQGLQRQISDQEEQKMSLEALLGEMEEQHRQNKQELNILQKMLYEAADNKEITLEEKEQLARQLQKLEQEAGQIEEANASLQKKIEELTPDIYQKEQTIKIVQDEMEKLQEKTELQQKKSDDLLKKLEEISSDKDELDEENHKLKEQLSILEREKEWLGMRIADYLSETEAYKATVDLQEKTIEQLERSLEKERKAKES